MLWYLALAVLGAAIVMGLTAPPAKSVRRSGPEQEPEFAPGYELDGSPVDAATLARLGTPDTVAELVTQGRADELRGLGYRGELPPEG